MNCSNCKNPIPDNSTECEWCGNSVLSSNLGSNCILNFYLNPRTGILVSRFIIELFVDGMLIKEFSNKEGINFEFKLTNPNPEISWSINRGQYIGKLPTYVFDFKNKKYRLTWAREGFWGIFVLNKPIINVTE